MGYNYTAPPKIKEHRHSNFYEPIWHMAHNKDDMFTAVICGRRGAGKSRTLIQMGCILDRKSDDIPRFKMENVCFSGSQFSDKLNSKQPKGTVIILDDAGIAMYSKESMTKVVRKLGQLLQSIRTKHYIILMSLPMFKMLEGHARMMTPIFLDIVGRDTKRNQNRVKIQKLQVNTFSGVIYRKTMTKKITKDHPRFNLIVTTREPDILRVDKPNKELDDEYEEHKESFLKPWRQQKANEIKREEKESVRIKRYGKSFPEAFKFIEDRWTEFVSDKGTIDDGLIMLLTDENNKAEISTEHAKRIARVLNSRLRKGELKTEVKEVFKK